MNELQHSNHRIFPKDHVIRRQAYKKKQDKIKKQLITKYRIQLKVLN